MKRIVYVLMSTLTAVVLLFGYHTSTSSHLATSGMSAIVTPVQGGITNPSSGTRKTLSAAGSPPSNTKSSTSTATPKSQTAGKTSPSSSPASSPSSSPARTVTGAAADTQYGPVQVQLTVKSNKITHVSVIEYPNGEGRDQEINATALPILINETLTTQNAKIDMVSGATYTSQGYLTSLQSALDKAGL